MNFENRGDLSGRLDALFQAYKESCPAPEPSANFMPQIWRRIEERQRSIFFMGRWARALATAAAVLSLGIAGYLYVPRSSNSVVSMESYVEALSSAHASDNMDLVEVAAVDEM
jgi:hypothetical protein